MRQQRRPWFASAGSWSALFVVTLAVGAVGAVGAAAVVIAHGAGWLGGAARGDTAGAGAALHGSAPRAGGVWFETNRGQLDPRVSFQARGNGYRLALTSEGAVLTAAGDRRHAATPERPVTMRVPGGRFAGPIATGRVAAASHYFVGNDRARWRQGVDSYTDVRFPGVKPGLDVVFHGGGPRLLEYDLVLAPGADEEAVTLAFDGADQIAVDADGALDVRAGRTKFHQAAPIAYQIDGAGRRVPLAARFTERSDRTVGFVVAPHDRARELVIDPTVVYSSYLGGSGYDFGSKVAVDGSGATYLLGYTESSDLPVVGAAQPTYHGNGDFFVVKLDPSGMPVYTTYLGGSSTEELGGIAVDASGSVYVTGNTLSTDYPTVSPLQASNHGADDVVVSKLDPTGALVFSTYLGGTSSDSGAGIAVDQAGTIYVVGGTFSPDFPTASPLQPTLGDSSFGDAFITKIGANGALIYSSYLGGSGADRAIGVAAGPTVGQAFVVGHTLSLDIPTASPFQPNQGGTIFVAKLDATGSLVYARYLGGENDDMPVGIAVDAVCAAYIAGDTSSTFFPRISALQPQPRGLGDGFLSKINPAGTSLVYSTYVGGSQVDHITGLAVDATGAVYLTGSTFSADFPLASPMMVMPAPTPVRSKPFVSKLAPSGASLAYSTFLGGSGDDAALGIAVNSAGTAVVTGQTTSPDFPIVAGFQPTYHGCAGAPGCFPLLDGFVTKISPATPPPVPASSAPTSAALAALLLLVSLRFVRSRG